MAVSWMTNGTTATSTCNYGTSSSSLSSTATGIQTSYWVTWHHHVVLPGLTPSTQFYYSCGDAAAGFSPVLSFWTAPAAGSEFPATIAVFGDMGTYNSNGTFADLARIADDINFIFHIGDVSYADDDFLHDPLVDAYEATWDKFLTDMQPFMDHLPYMVLPGNHEAECHSPTCFLDSQKREAFANFSALNHRFRMPSPESNGTMNMWYSFDYGSIHFVSIDTETDYPNSPNDDYSSKNGGFGNQMAWLAQDLASAAARRRAGKVSWIIVGGHRPVYSRAECDANGVPTGSAAALQTAVEDLFLQAGVDLYFAGHVHASEVSWPTYNNTVVESYTNPPYTTYIVTGAAGCDEGHTSYASSPVTAWNRFSNDQDYGLSTLHFQDANTLTVNFRRGTDGTVLDSFTLTRQH